MRDLVLSGSSARLRGAAEFWAPVLRALSWRAVVLTQLLALVFALSPWMEAFGSAGRPRLLPRLLVQAAAAAFMLLAALAADEAVRRGWSVRRAFLVVLPCAAGVPALAGLLIGPGFGPAGAGSALARFLTILFQLGEMWGITLMVYLNRQSAERILARVRTGELERLQAERQLIASRLAVAETQLDAAVVMRRLGQTRDLYAAASPDADRALDGLIVDLRSSVAPGSPA